MVPGSGTAPGASPVGSPAASSAPRRIPLGRSGRLPGGEHHAMIELGSALGIGIAFMGGLVSFASPCCLPLVPAYISLHGGRDR